MSPKKVAFRLAYAIILVLALITTVGISVLLESKIQVFNYISRNQDQTEPTPFPVSVNISTKTIVEDPSVDEFFYKTLALNETDNSSWWSQVATLLFSRDWYQNLASPVTRIIVIWPGERHEQVAKNTGDVLHWNAEEKDEFVHLIQSQYPVLAEGKFLPGKYVTHRNARPEEIAQVLVTKFQNEVLSRYTPEIETQVPLQDALIIASLLEREASGFQNMREISGVIWNRLFIEMPLQLDATLQYARGSRTYEPSWWPKVVPQDKFIESPFNTYKHEGLPPAPIANPSVEAIVAALNPIETNCLYYFHTDDKQYFCSDSYEEHVNKLRSLYGRGR